MDGPPAYPPERHVLRDLAVRIERGPDGTTRASMPVHAAVAAPSGAVLTGALATLVDVAGGALAVAAAGPGWAATTDLSLHLTRPVRVGDVGEVEARCRPLRRGRTTLVLAVELVAGGSVSGVATMTWALLTRHDVNPVLPGAGDTSVTTFVSPTSGFRTPLVDSAGLRVVDAAAGTVHLPLRDYVVNGLGALQGGMVALAAEQSAAVAAGARLGVPSRTVDLDLLYLELGKVGPAVATADVRSVAPGHARVRVEVRDAGRDGRLMTVARAVVVGDRS